MKGGFFIHPGTNAFPMISGEEGASVIMPLSTGYGAQDRFSVGDVLCPISPGQGLYL